LALQQSEANRYNDPRAMLRSSMLRLGPVLHAASTGQSFTALACVRPSPSAAHRCQAAASTSSTWSSQTRCLHYQPETWSGFQQPIEKVGSYVAAGTALTAAAAAAHRQRTPLSVVYVSALQRLRSTAAIHQQLWKLCPPLAVSAARRSPCLPPGTRTRRS
jgi:hypothetical protein